LGVTRADRPSSTAISKQPACGRKTSSALAIAPIWLSCDCGTPFALTLQKKQNIIHQEQSIMLRWALIFLVVALLAALFGFTGIAAGAASIGRFLFFLFLVLFVISLILGMTRRGPIA